LTVLRWPDGRRRAAGPRADGDAPADEGVVPLEALGVAVWRVDGATRRVAAANALALALLGRTQDEVVGADAAALLATPEDEAFWAEAAADPAAQLRSRTVLARGDGTLRHVERWIRPGGAGGGWVVSLVDLSEQHAAERAREHVLAELRATLEATADGLLVTDLAGRVQAWNERFVELWGVPEALLGPRNGDALFAWMQREIAEPADDHRRVLALRAAAHAPSHDRLVLRSGRVVERVSRPLAHGERAAGRVYSFRDISERIAADRRLELMSFTDALTGLPNRRYLAGRLGPASALAARGLHSMALLYLDLDHFKQVNDSLGHELGDRVLREVAARLRAAAREGDLIARVGGDQFVLLLHQVGPDGGEHGARRLLDAIAEPFAVDGSTFTLTCSIGLAVFPRDAAQPEDLVRHAETAMLQAKQAGRAGYRVHRAPATHVDLRSRIELDHAMRQALASNRFRLHYQPQVALAGRRLVGVEALVRWRDPERGDVPPAEFIPVAEDSGFVVAIGDWVLERAVQQAAQWHAEGLAVPVAVNVSALQFQHDRFVERVGELLRAAALPPHLLELELTESILLRDAADALARLHALAALGVQLAIDDFGTGYSSLAYLKRFPIRKLKIDRRFVGGLPGDEGDAGIVRAIVQIGHALALTVIAEGVETEAQRDFLAACGCDEAQGYLFAPPLDVALATRHLRLARTTNDA
jgi:diguanylate cyclase (GGDEF)-like protein